MADPNVVGIDPGGAPNVSAPLTAASMVRRVRLIGVLWMAAVVGTAFGGVFGWLVYTTPVADDGLVGRVLRACCLKPSERKALLASDLKQQAQAVWDRLSPRPLSGPLLALLGDAEADEISTQPHPLLNSKAPLFTLPNSKGNPVSLAEQYQRGPVVVVFYYGYWCDHCVAQLFGLNKDISYFEELDTTILAISADTPEVTRQRFAQYGAFSFPVLSDQGNKIAERYGVYTPVRDQQDELILHGTFVIDQDGIIRWADRGPEPFAHNKTLLRVLARITGRDGLSD